MVVYQLRNIPERYGGMVVYQGLNRQEGCQKIFDTSGAAFKKNKDMFVCQRCSRPERYSAMIVYKRCKEIVVLQWCSRLESLQGNSCMVVQQYADLRRDGCEQVVQQNRKIQADVCVQMV